MYLQSARQCERDRYIPVDRGYYPDAVGLAQLFFHNLVACIVVVAHTWRIDEFPACLEQLPVARRHPHTLHEWPELPLKSIILRVHVALEFSLELGSGGCRDLLSSAANACYARAKFEFTLELFDGGVRRDLAPISTTHSSVHPRIRVIRSCIYVASGECKMRSTRCREVQVLQFTGELVQTLLP